jgi:hypothetical protein
MALYTYPVREATLYGILPSKVDSYTASQKKSAFMEPECSSKYTQMPANGSYPIQYNPYEISGSLDAEDLDYGLSAL